MKKQCLDEYLGENVKIVFFDGKIASGTLGFVKEFSAQFDYRKPGYYTIENFSFKASHVKKIEVL